MKLTNLVGVLVVGMGALVGRGAVITVDGTAYTTAVNAGAGSNSALLVLEYGAGGTYTFGYSWNTPAAGASGPSGTDMLLAVAAATQVSGGPVMTVDSATYDFGDGPTVFVNSISYGSQQVSYTYPSSWFGYFISQDGSSWTSPAFGASDRALTDGSFDDWVHQTTAAVAPNFDTPTSPTFGVAAVPEPASLGLLGVGGVLLLRRRR